MLDVTGVFLQKNVFQNQKLCKSWLNVVLLESANLMYQHEGLTYERDATRREPFALRSSCSVYELTDDLSTAMVKQIQNR